MGEVSINAYDVFLVRFDCNVNRRYLPIPGLQQVFGINQKAAENIVRNLPRVVKRNVPLEIAAQYADALNEIGAEVELRPSRDDSSREAFNATMVDDSVPPCSRPDDRTSKISGSEPSSFSDVSSANRISARAASISDAASEATLEHGELPSFRARDSRIPPQFYPRVDTPPNPQPITPEPMQKEQKTDREARRPETASSAKEPSVSSKKQPADELSYTGHSVSFPFPIETNHSDKTGQKALVREDSTVRASPDRAARSLLPADASSRSSDSIGIDSRALTRPSDAASNLRAFDSAVSPQGAEPRIFPPTKVSPGTAPTQDPIPPDVLRKSFWAPGTGFFLAGSILIFIGLSFNESIFTGNAGNTDYLFDGLGICLIVWGLYKLFTKRGDS